MARGLLWLPLLFIFIWLAWAGWNEYQKLEAYRRWAQTFERAKYDIYAVLGQNGSEVTWGKPTRNGPINVQTFSLKQVHSIRLLADRQAVEPTKLPTQSRSAALEFQLHNSSAPICIPFTDLSLAAQWFEKIYDDWQHLALDGG